MIGRYGKVVVDHPYKLMQRGGGSSAFIVKPDMAVSSVAKLMTDTERLPAEGYARGCIVVELYGVNLRGDGVRVY